MDDKWVKKFRSRAKETLHRMKKLKEHTPDFDDDPLQQYKLVSCFFANLIGKKKKRQGGSAPPVNGTALYYVTDYGDEVKLLHPVLLKTYSVSRRAFDKGVSDVWWPNELAKENPNAKNQRGFFCNRFSVADRMLAKLKFLAEIQKLKKTQQKVVREAIADLKEIPLDQVPKYKIVEKETNSLQKWKDHIANLDYKKRGIKLLQRIENKENEMSSKDKKKKKASASSSSASSSASSAASSSNDKKKKKSSKKAKPEKKSKGKGKDKAEKKSGELKAMRGKKTVRGVVSRYLLKHKGKKVSVKQLCEEVQKARGMKKEFPEKKLLAKTKAFTKWAEAAGVPFKASSSGVKLG